MVMGKIEKNATNARITLKIRAFVAKKIPPQKRALSIVFL